jgi:hypothetical protein
VRNNNLISKVSVLFFVTIFGLSVGVVQPMAKSFFRDNKIDPSKLKLKALLIM